MLSLTKLTEHALMHCLKFSNQALWELREKENNTKSKCIVKRWSFRKVLCSWTRCH